ncbi:MAG: STAS/SEC14 domain-containing protein [Kiloniellales bacterium]|nr:STAS/SEC14 domain-containing protein [Kiloniellales bacterium]
MLEVISEPGRSFLVFKVSGLVRSSHIVERMTEVNSLIAETRPRGLLCDWTELEGWDEESESLRFFARLEVRDKFERIAVLAAKAWHAEVSRLQEIMDVPIRRFSPSDRDTAMAWLETDSP